MPDMKTQAQSLLTKVQSPTGEGGASVTPGELGQIKSQIAASTHPRLLSDELNKATSNLTGPQQKELDSYANDVIGARASAGQAAFDGLSALNNINRINPASWIINGHWPLTKPE